MSGSSFHHTFNHSGTYEYYCMVHPWTLGKVVVGGDSTVKTGSAPTLDLFTHSAPSVTSATTDYPYIPPQISSGDSARFSIGVTNSGPDSLDSSVQFEIRATDPDGNVVLDIIKETAPVISSGGAKGVYHDLLITSTSPSGTYTWSMTVDPNNLIPETNENNNGPFTGTFSVPALESSVSDWSLRFCAAGDTNVDSNNIRTDCPSNIMGGFQSGEFVSLTRGYTADYISPSSGAGSGEVSLVKKISGSIPDVKLCIKDIPTGIQARFHDHGNT